MSPANWRTAVVGPACTACGVCLATCPRRAILRGVSVPWVLQSRCDGCLACVEVCPRGAISDDGPRVGDLFGDSLAITGAGGSQP